LSLHGYRGGIRVGTALVIRHGKHGGEGPRRSVDVSRICLRAWRRPVAKVPGKARNTPIWIHRTSTAEQNARPGRPTVRTICFCDWCLITATADCYLRRIARALIVGDAQGGRECPWRSVCVPGIGLRARGCSRLRIRSLTSGSPAGHREQSDPRLPNYTRRLPPKASSTPTGQRSCFRPCRR
jgi:hypothetical protein